MSQSTIGGIYVLLFFVIIGVLLYLGVKYIDPLIGRYHARQRDKEIETHMRLGMRDAERQREIARRIIQEEQMRQQHERDGRGF